MVSRRSFLAGSLGVLVAGVGGRELLERNPSLNPLAQDYPAPGAHADVQRGTLASRHMNSDLGWGLFIPKTQPIGTVFSLHGRGGNSSKTFRELKLQNFVAAAQLPLAVAAVDGGDHSYWHARKDGTDALAMLLNEFIPMIEAKTGTTKRALYGWSMGGYGALLAAQRKPEMFRAVTALSPALWVKSSQSAPGAFDDAQDFQRNDVFARRDHLQQTDVLISCGNSDPFFSASKSFVQGHPAMHTNFGPGAHDAAYWRSVTPATLSFLMAALTRS